MKNSLKGNGRSRLRSRGLPLSQHIIAGQCSQELHEIINLAVGQLKCMHAFVQVVVGVATSIVQLHDVALNPSHIFRSFSNTIDLTDCCSALSLVRFSGAAGEATAAVPAAPCGLAEQLMTANKSANIKPTASVDFVI